MFSGSRFGGARKIITAASLAAAALCGGEARAQIGSFGISDGSTQLLVGGLVGNRFNAAAGSASLLTSTGAVPVDHLFQNWFWYRTGSDTREYALSNQLAASNASGNRARLFYLEPINDGAQPNVLLFDLEYTVSDRTGGANRPETIFVTITFSVRNLSNQQVAVRLFSYNDFDLAGAQAGDRCDVIGTADHIQRVGDATGTQFEDVRASYIVSATAHAAFEVDAYPNILAKLSDGGPDTLGNTGDPFGPGDYTGANQWDVMLLPAGSPLDTFKGAVTLEIRTNTCEADINTDNRVNSSDISAFLTRWLGAVNGGCP